VRTFPLVHIVKDKSSKEKKCRWMPDVKCEKWCDLGPVEWICKSKSKETNVTLEEKRLSSLCCNMFYYNQHFLVTQGKWINSSFLK